jgi:hypothetical protein
MRDLLKYWLIGLLVLALTYLWLALATEQYLAHPAR